MLEPAMVKPSFCHLFATDRLSRFERLRAEKNLSGLTRSAAHVLLERRGKYVLDVDGSMMDDSVLRLLGWLRAEAFGAIGEGLSKAFDNDEYDRDYRHLIIWDDIGKDVIGAYRLTSVNENGHTSSGGDVYTATLYHYEQSFFHRIGPSMELGRAFVTPKYQRSVEPLFLLWQGIGRIIEKEPQHRYLFGAVSISKTYAAAARSLILRELWRERVSRGHDGLACLPVHARRPAAFSRKGITRWLDRHRALNALSTLDRKVRALDGEGKGVPVLFTKYLDLGGTFLAFHDDQEFGSVACLAILDLMKVEPRVLTRFMGTGGAEALWRYHGRTAV